MSPRMPICARVDRRCASPGAARAPEPKPPAHVREAGRGPAPRRLGARGVAAAVVAVLAVIGLPADAQNKGSRLHEFVPPDPNEDVRLAATTLDGNLPAALETPSGVATAPDPSKAPDDQNLYSGGTTDDSPESTYEPDRDTRQPDIESYDDPFSPSTAPFKRLRAYDSVDAGYVLRVADKATKLLTVGGTVESGDESFYGDLSVELLPDDLVRIPTVGPGARVVKMHVSPDAKVSLLRDGADNWFIRGAERKRVRVVMQLAIPRAAFGSEFRGDADFDTLARYMPDFAPHKAQAERVFEAIGISRAMRPKDVVGKMVEYYRGFHSSNDPPRSHGDIFLDLALSKKGVCRHRAFAFLVTSLEIGIPARMVVNEAHAWVEVFDSVMWHRIDLGGAALDIDDPADLTRPQHQPPQDPYTWPEGAEQTSGQELADKERTGAAGSGGGGPAGPSDPGGSSAVPSPTATDPTQPAPSNPDLPGSTLELEVVDKTVRRGAAIRVKGRVLAQSRPCANVRVDVVVRSDELPARSIGSLSTDEDGAFDGTAVVPRDLEAGDYDVLVVTRGDKRCGAGKSE